MSRWTGGAKKQGRLRLLFGISVEGWFVKIVYMVVVVCFLLLHTDYARNRGGMCYTTKCDTVEDGLTERASEGSPGR
jgi:hypothetical protein